MIQLRNESQSPTRREHGEQGSRRAALCATTIIAMGDGPFGGKCCRDNEEQPRDGIESTGRYSERYAGWRDVVIEERKRDGRGWPVSLVYAETAAMRIKLDRGSLRELDLR
jgi:hypothetical protein